MATKKPQPKSRNPVIEFDKLQMYFGEPYVIDLEDTLGSITVYQPTIGDIISLGSNRFYSTLNIFTQNTTSVRLMLWDAGIDWNELSDFELFIIFYKRIDPEISKLIFKDINWDSFIPCLKGEQKLLYSQENNLEITEEVYFHMSQYLRNVFNTFPEEKLTRDKLMKQWYIRKDKRHEEIEGEKAKHGEESKSDYSSYMMSLVSSLINHPGFKYNLKELKEVGVCQFYDSVRRLQVYENSTALLKGIYGGMVSAKDIDPNEFNFMRIME